MADTYSQPRDGWVCFHCGERFMSYGVARDHFGEAPGVLLKCRALRADLGMMAAALEPFCGPGGGADMQAFHDLEDEVVVWENSGKAVTAGDVRRARVVLARYQGVPVSEMHLRRRYLDAVGEGQ